MLDCGGADEGQRDGVCGRGGLLQSQQRPRQRRQRGERSPQHQVRSDCIEGLKLQSCKVIKFNIIYIFS